MGGSTLTLSSVGKDDDIEGEICWRTLGGKGD